MNLEMRLDWIVLHPAAPYAALAIGMSLCLFLFVSLKRDLRAAEDRSNKKIAALEADWQAKTAILDERWSELSQISGLLVSPPPLRSGMNLTKRSQALQMSRRGESAKEIAATLSLPQMEVDLLLKVQRLGAGA
jgi:DNA-binding NarL/FixJ family response regulator